LKSVSPEQRTVVLLGLSVHTATEELQLPTEVALVRLVGKGYKGSGKQTVLRGRPLLYHDLLHAIAHAHKMPATTDSDRRVMPRTKTPGVDDAALANCLILLAEDNETNSEVMRAQLDMLGYAVEVASDGLKALEMWRSGRYALLLTDCHMPNMDGFELTSAIRSAEAKDTHLPIIAVTANAMEGELQHCLQRGMDDYLSKPLRLHELRPMLAKWLPHAQAGADIIPDADSLHKKAGAEDSPYVHNENNSSADSPVWDNNTLRNLVGDNTAMHRRFLKKFVANAVGQMASIVTAATSGDLSTAAEIAHKLKSAARSVGALQLGDLCQQMETAARANDREAFSAIVPELKLAHDAAARAITELLG